MPTGPDGSSATDEVGVAEPAPPPIALPEPARTEGITRQTVEFLLLLGVGILLLRTFAAEAYIVPTGSMAPTLLGLHKELTCPNCRYPFVLGMDDEGRSGRAVCPNCGKDGLVDVPSVECNGDRLLVQKFLFDVRRPRRWEVAVFQSPGEPDQAYVKRVVGLPGDAIQIVDGDVHIDGRISRKSAVEQRAMRLLVFDNDYVPGDSDRFPRWRFRVEAPDRRVRPSGWQAKGPSFVHESVARNGDRLDWLEYRHYDPYRSRYGGVRDFCPYNGGDVRGDHVVRDLAIEADVSARPGVRAIFIRVDHGADHFQVTVPVDGQGRVEVVRNGLLQELLNPRGGLASSPGDAPRFARVEASAIDRRLSVLVDDVPLFDPIDFEKSRAADPATPGSPLALGVAGGSVEVRRVRVHRDIYYTGNLAIGPRRPFGVDSPYVLGVDEYFVLGDNSPVSNDSRFWETSPVVQGDRFLGKPFLVHLPGQVCPLKVFGRPLGWIPDPREIRYIR